MADEATGTISGTRSAVPGFDLEKLEEFRRFAEENPNEVLLGLRATTIWEGQGGDSLAKVGPWKLADQEVNKPTRDYSIQFGAWKEVEEEMGVERAHDRLEPVEAALASLCSCVNWAVCINAAREGVEFEGLEITARAKVDPRVLFAIVPLEEASSCLQSVEMDVNVRGDISEEDREKLLEMTKRSPVHTLLSNANEITTRINTS